MGWRGWLLILFVLAALNQAAAQGWYIGASQSFFGLSSNRTGALGLAAGVRLGGRWEVRGGMSVEVAQTFGLVGLSLDGMYRPPEGGYVGVGVGLEYAVVPTLPSDLETTLRAFLGDEWLVTPYWGVYLEGLLQYDTARNAAALGLRAGLNLYLERQDE